MNLTEQQLTLVYSKLGVLLSLDALRPEASREYDSQKIKILDIIIERGFHWALYEFDHTFSAEHGFGFLDKLPKEVEETFDILNMFRKHKDIRHEFIGFDTNHDDHHSIHQFLVEILRRYKELGDAVESSHCKILPRYQKLLQTYGC